MNDSPCITVTLSVKESELPFKVVLVATFSNVSDEPYFLDKKVVFFDGRYTLACLTVTNNGEKIKRKMNLKLKPSKFPDDYIEIKPNNKLVQFLELGEHFHLPEKGELDIEYSCRNLNHLTGEKESIKSKKLTWVLGNKNK